MEKDYQGLIKCLEERSNDNNFLEVYLKSGISDTDNRLYNYLINGIFEKEFYVPKHYKDDELFFSLIKDTTRNVLVLQAHGGSGKTTYIKMLEKRVSSQYECCHIDFGSIISEINPYHAVKRIILNKARKSLNKMLAPNETQVYTKNFEVNSLKILEFMAAHDEYQEAEKIWKDVYNDIINPENVKVAEQINKVMRSLSFENIGEYLSDNEGLLIIQMSCLLLVTLLLSNPIHQEHLIVFDNIEAINSAGLSSLSTIILRTHRFLNGIYNYLELDFCRKINFIISVRTTTNVCVDDPHNDTFWGTDGKYIHRLEYEDFCAEALLKKLKFLHNYPKLKETKLYQNLYLLCSLLCSQTVINDYLAEKMTVETDYRYFVREWLAPFFGNNFRQIVAHLTPIVLQSDLRDKIYELTLGNNKKLDFDIKVNGAREILMHNIYKGFMNNNIFSYFGIEYISGDATHSMIRVLLTFLYWDKYRFISDNVTTYTGASLGKIIDIFSNFYSNELMEEFIHLIYRLSPFSRETTLGGALAISRWSYLLVINNRFNYNIELSNISFMVNEYLSNNDNYRYELRNIKISISDAGFCFIANTANDFEFFNARNGKIKYSLFMYEKEKNISSKEYDFKYDFQFVIKENLITLENYINGMLDEGVSICHYRKDNRECSYCDLEESISKNSENCLRDNRIFLCSLYLRYIEVTEAVIDAINYVDRYRRYLWAKFTDCEIEESILDLLKEYGVLLRKIRNKVKKYTKFDIITSNLCSHNANDIIEKFRTPKQAYYFKKWRKDYLFDAIDFLKKSKEDKSKGIFDVCKTLAEKSTFQEKVNYEEEV